MKGTLRKTCAARFGLRRADTERSRTIHHPTLTETERRQTWPSKVLQSKSSHTFLQIHPRHPGASWLAGCRYLRYRARSHQTFTRDGGSMTIRSHNCITIIVPGSEEIVSAVFVILLMFCAVIVMVIRVDNNREKCAARVYRFERHEKLGSQS